MVVRDENTAEIAHAVAVEIQRLTGARPYMVVAQVSRRWIDLNRPPEAAFEASSAAAARPIWDAYHKAITDAVAAVRRDFGRGLLIDIHGQAAVPDAALRGTGDGATVQGLLQRAGPALLTGPDGLMGRLAAQGVAVFPAVGSAAREHPQYNGGFTVRTYGRLPEVPIDAIQIEFGGNLRRPERIGATATALARAIVEYANAQLPAPPQAR